MLKTLIAGIFLGVAGVLAALYAIPVVDQHRETSIISVMPNGGNTESFHISVPTDRIALATSAVEQSYPTGLVWPADSLFDDVSIELYKLRDARDVVVGVASRLAANDQLSGPAIEWVLHLPARGTVYVAVSPESGEEGARRGVLRHGTREFARLTGGMTERWVPAAGDQSTEGRIQLETAFLGVAEPLE